MRSSRIASNGIVERLETHLTAQPVLWVKESQRRWVEASYQQPTAGSIQTADGAEAKALRIRIKARLMTGGKSANRGRLQQLLE